MKARFRNGLVGAIAAGVVSFALRAFVFGNDTAEAATFAFVIAAIVFVVGFMTADNMKRSANNEQEEQRPDFGDWNA